MPAAPASPISCSPEQVAKTLRGLRQEVEVAESDRRAWRKGLMSVFSAHVGLPRAELAAAIAEMGDDRIEQLLRRIETKAATAASDAERYAVREETKQAIRDVISRRDELSALWHRHHAGTMAPRADREIMRRWRALRDELARELPHPQLSDASLADHARVALAACRREAEAARDRARSAAAEIEARGLQAALEAMETPPTEFEAAEEAKKAYLAQQAIVLDAMLLEARVEARLAYHELCLVAPDPLALSDADDKLCELVRLRDARTWQALDIIATAKSALTALRARVLLADAPAARGDIASAMTRPRAVGHGVAPDYGSG